MRIFLLVSLAKSIFNSNIFIYVASTFPRLSTLVKCRVSDTSRDRPAQGNRNKQKSAIYLMAIISFGIFIL